MKYRKNLTKIALSLIVSGLLVGCGDSRSLSSNLANNQTAEPKQTLLGSVVKGAIDGANIAIYDAENKKIAFGTSKEGKFKINLQTLTSAYYRVKSQGGTYTDEATKSLVNIDKNDGLETLLTKAELETMIKENKFASLTPETTIFTALVKENLNDNNLSMAMMKAEKLIYNLMIKDSSPIPDMQGDKFLKTGDLTKAIPSTQSEAFAKNRAVSFSNLVKALGLNPKDAFDIIDKLEEDYKDGKADSIEIDGKNINLTQEFALSRIRLFESTTTRLRDGNLSDTEQQEFQVMGFDIKGLIADKSNKDKMLKDKVTKYLASTTLPTLHILPTMIDEDGKSQDAKATYTLTANKDVMVKIETPDGSWNTPMWRYNSNPLPLVIKTSRGNAMTLKFNNKLEANSTIHWHGFKIPAIMDGGPDVPVKANESKIYSFTMNQPASPLWFHPHPDMQTGKQVYMGLAGVYLIEDEISKKLEADKALPSDSKDVVLLVQDRRFDSEQNGVKKLLYKTKMMDSDGMKGATILVNGSVIPKLEVDTTQYRFRLYNVSNAKTYDFAFNDGRKFKIVATDGGFLNSPVEVDHIMLGAAERVELVVDFSQDAVDSKILMVSRPFKDDMMNMGIESSNSNAEMAMEMEMESTNMEDNGIGLTIMRFDVTKEATDEVTLYTSLPANAEIATRLDPTSAINQGNSRKFVMSMYNGQSGGSEMSTMDDASNTNSTMNMTFSINSKIFDPNRVDEFVGAGTTEIWELKNISPMAHPFHAHAIQYQILDRNGVPATGTDLGWKDTFLVQPGETVRIIGKFEAVNVGDYMYHCHILEHEDAGMMGYFRVGDSGNIKIK